MFFTNNLKNYLYDKKYSISIFENNVHVFNYLKLENFTDKIVNLKMDNFNLIIKGEELFINKMLKNELLIRGNIKSLEID